MASARQRLVRAMVRALADERMRYQCARTSIIQHHQSVHFMPGVRSQAAVSRFVRLLPSRTLVVNLPPERSRPSRTTFSKRPPTSNRRHSTHPSLLHTRTRACAYTHAALPISILRRNAFDEWKNAP